MHWAGTSADELAKHMHELNTGDASLTMITNRGIKVWPEGFEETFCTDHWRCRFKPESTTIMQKPVIAALLAKAESFGIDVVKTENLYHFNGQPAYSLGQGQ